MDLIRGEGDVEIVREFVANHQQVIGVIGAMVFGGLLVRLIVPELITWRRAWRAARYWGRCTDCGEAQVDLTAYPDGVGRAEPYCWRCWETWPEDRPVPELAVGLRSPVDPVGLLDVGMRAAVAVLLLVVLVAMAVTVA